MRNYSAIIRDYKIKGYAKYMAKGQKGVSVVMCMEHVIGNLMDSTNGFHAPKPDLDVKQENNNPTK